MTSMVSQFLIVDNLWAIITVVRSFETYSIDLCNDASVSLSTADVASSKISNGAFQNRTSNR